MRSIKTVLVLAAVVLALGGGYLYRQRPVEVSLVRLSRGNVIDAVYATGEARALRRAEISPETNARVMEVLAEEGDTVSAGEVLARLENKRPVLSREMAEQAAERARATWKEADRDLERRAVLYQRGAVSKAEYDRAARDEERARAELKRLEAALAIESDQLGKSELASPLSGVLIAKRVEPGEFVTAGRAIFTVIDPSSLMVVVNVDETEVAKVAAGQEVHLSLDAFPGVRYRGVVDRVVPRVDEITRTGEVRIRFSEETPGLAEGMSATVNIVTRALEGALLVPRGSVTLGRERAHVFRVRDGVVEKVEFVPGAMDEDMVEVKEGPLQEGDAVIREPGEEIVEGLEVRVSE